MLSKMQEKELLLKIGKRIRELREERELTQFHLACDANISKNQIGRVERGEYGISITSLIKIAIALDVEVDQFFIYLKQMSV